MGFSKGQSADDIPTLMNMELVDAIMDLIVTRNAISMYLQELYG
jgi:hypothetical protein